MCVRLEAETHSINTERIFAAFAVEAFRFYISNLQVVVQVTDRTEMWRYEGAAYRLYILPVCCFSVWCCCLGSYNCWYHRRLNWAPIMNTFWSSYLLYPTGETSQNRAQLGNKNKKNIMFISLQQKSHLLQMWATQHRITLIKNRYTYRTFMIVGVVFSVTLAAVVVTCVVKKGQELCMKKDNNLSLRKL